MNYVKSGKRLMIFAGAGGHLSAQTNLNSLSSDFEFILNDGVLFDQDTNACPWDIDLAILGT